MTRLKSRRSSADGHAHLESTSIEYMYICMYNIYSKWSETLPCACYKLLVNLGYPSTLRVTGIKIKDTVACSLNGIPECCS